MSYELALYEITPLQQRVLEAMKRARSTKEIAQAAGLVRIPHQTHRATKRRNLRREPDTITTRNALGWLTAKGLVKRESDGSWRRVFAFTANERRARQHRYQGGRKTGYGTGRVLA